MGAIVRSPTLLHLYTTNATYHLSTHPPLIFPATQIDEFLQSIPTFQHLSKKEVMYLTSQCRERTFEAGQHILSLHDVPVLAYVVHSGSVDVMKSDIVKKVCHVAVNSLIRIFKRLCHLCHPYSNPHFPLLRVL